MCFILDMVGDEVGWKNSLWVIGVMLGVSMILQLKLWRVDEVMFRCVEKKKVGNDHQLTNDVELVEMGNSVGTNMKRSDVDEGSNVVVANPILELRK